MSNIASGEDGLQNADAESIQKVKQDLYPMFEKKLMLDARRDAIIDVFIEKCHRGVSGDFISEITRSPVSFHFRSILSDDDVAFVSELKSELVKDLHGAGLLKSELLDPLDPDAYYEIEDDVTRRLKIWAASKERSQDSLPAHQEGFLESATLAGRRSSRSAYEELQSFKDGGGPTLEQTSDEQGIKLLSSAVQGEQVTATFACGGSIQIRASDDNTSTNNDRQVSSPPVVLRWDNPEKTATHRLELPRRRGQGQELEKLLRHCQPATFGLGGVNVLNESYRKASKLDNTEFSTNFSPYDYGIVDTIAQILFPSVEENGSGDLGLEVRGVRAELYKLNIYSGPSGMFHSHVDTPRGEGQFGSLVVCLPSAHTGGELLVRHKGKTTTFDWSTASGSSSCIRWAAFYSDCEHEVLEVTSGHRLTLSYNLYIREHDYLRQSPYRALGRTLTMSPEKLPLYRVVNDLLDQPGFLREGAVLGFFCSHQYAHTHGDPPRRVPRSLKGVDMAIYAVFRALGLRIEILPVLGVPRTFHSYQLNFGGVNLDYSGRRQSFLEWLEQSKRRLLSAREDGGMAPKPTVDDVWLEYQSYNSEDEDDKDRNPEVTDHEDYKDVQTRLQTILRTRQIKGMSTVPDPVIAGTELHEWVEDACLNSEDYKETRNEDWPNVNLPRVQWLNEPKHTESALTHLAYGNQAEMLTYYSAAALLVIVPPSSERGPFPICRSSKRRHSEQSPAAHGNIFPIMT